MEPIKTDVIQVMIRKAIIPIAGLGTRLLPLTAITPKALLPVYDRPAIQWIVEELVSVGIEKIFFIYSKGQEAIIDYFGPDPHWMEYELSNRSKFEELKSICYQRDLAKFYFLEQEEQLGDGHAIEMAKEYLENEPFLVVFSDCLTDFETVKADDKTKIHGSLEQMLAEFEKHRCSTIGLAQVNESEVFKFGIVETDDANKITSVIEKPEFGTTRSTSAIVGRYILTPEIWNYLGNSESGEIRIADALVEMIKHEEVYGIELKYEWLDTGTIEGLWKAGEKMRSKIKPELVNKKER